MYVPFPVTSRWQDLRMNDEVEASRSRCWAAVLDGLMTQTQVVRMELDEAESVADRVLEGLDRHRLTVIDRDLVADWMQVVPTKLDALLELPSRGTAVCDDRGYHDMTFVSLAGRWPHDVVLCDDCGHAVQVERG
jgi:hypothetical protein